MQESMEERKEGAGGGWMSVPAFGDWDLKNGVPDYSMDFSKIREMRKQNKRELSRASLGNEEELIPNRPRDDDNHHRADLSAAADHRRPLRGPEHSPTGRKKFMSYFNCCIKA